MCARTDWANVKVTVTRKFKNKRFFCCHFRCLDKDKNRRSSSNDLLQHRFIANVPKSLSKVRKCMMTPFFDRQLSVAKKDRRTEASRNCDTHSFARTRRSCGRENFHTRKSHKKRTSTSALTCSFFVSCNGT